MKTFEVDIENTVWASITVEAENEKEAKDKVLNMERTDDHFEDAQTEVTAIRQV